MIKSLCVLAAAVGCSAQYAAPLARGVVHTTPVAAPRAVVHTTPVTAPRAVVHTTPVAAPAVVHTTPVAAPVAKVPAEVPAAPAKAEDPRKAAWAQRDAFDKLENTAWDAQNKRIEQISTTMDMLDAGVLQGWNVPTWVKPMATFNLARSRFGEEGLYDEKYHQLVRQDRRTPTEEMSEADYVKLVTNRFGREAWRSAALSPTFTLIDGSTTNTPFSTSSYYYMDHKATINDMARWNLDYAYDQFDDGKIDRSELRKAERKELSTRAEKDSMRLKFIGGPQTPLLASHLLVESAQTDRFQAERDLIKAEDKYFLEPNDDNWDALQLAELTMEALDAKVRSRESSMLSTIPNSFLNAAIAKPLASYHWNEFVSLTSEKKDLEEEIAEDKYWKQYSTYPQPVYNNWDDDRFFDDRWDDRRRWRDDRWDDDRWW